MTTLEDDLRAALRAQVRALRVPDRPVLDRDVVEFDVAPRRTPRRRRWSAMFVGAAAAAAAAVGVIAVVTIVSDGSTVMDSGPGTDADAAFDEALDASGVLTSPSPDEVDQAMDGGLYRDVETEVSAAGNYVSLRRCRDEAAFRCGSSWAYITGDADGAELHGGLLGDVDDLHLLDDRFFVAAQNATSPGTPPVAWVIDAVTGKVGTLRWVDEPTMLNAPEQAPLLCQRPNVGCAQAHGSDVGLPTIVDARDGTIRPLAMPEYAAPALPVAQLGDGRVWVGTAPDDGRLGLAYSDDGGASWTETALPVDLTSDDLPSAGSFDRRLEIAADGDRVAVASSWGWGNDPGRDQLYLSNDAGRSWTAIPSEPHGNGARLYVLADGRLVLEWGLDNYPAAVLVSTGSDWTELEDAGLEFVDATSVPTSQRFRVNSAGVALIPSWIMDDAAESQTLDTTDFSADLTRWRTIESPRRLTDLFDAAIDASGVLARPSVDEFEQAMDSRYRDAETQVSATGNYVTLRRCRDSAASVCGTGWAYISGNPGREMVGPGLLGDADHLDLHLLDDRHFVAVETSPDTQVPASTWLIDSVTGQVGILSWLDEPTTLNAPEQALLLCRESYNTGCSSGNLPMVVDARDGTIRPLAMPDDVAAGVPVAQHGTARIWVATDPEGDAVGLAYSDDGGATWTDVALPTALSGTISEEHAGPQELEIAADGDRVAATSNRGGNGARHTVYVSDDAGHSWTATETPPAGNIGHLYVLADGRLVLLWSQDAYPVHVLVSWGSDWSVLQQPPEEMFDKVHFLHPPQGLWGGQRFSVNRAGIAVVASFVVSAGNETPYDDDDRVGARLNTTDFTTDLTTWQTVDSFDD